MTWPVMVDENCSAPAKHSAEPGAGLIGRLALAPCKPSAVAEESDVLPSMIPPSALACQPKLSRDFTAFGDRAL